MLRLLDPVQDIELFREAYSWRSKPKKHAQPDRMSFEDFTAQDERQIVIGLFDDDDFQAVYVLIWFAPKRYEVHFTARRDVARERLLEAAKEIRDSFFACGVEELSAWITPRNRPLLNFLTDLGFSATGAELCVNDTEFCCKGAGHSDTLPSQTRVFVNMAVKVNPAVGPFGSQTNLQAIVDHDESIRLSERT